MALSPAPPPPPIVTLTNPGAHAPGLYAFVRSAHLVSQLVGTQNR
jgi:hypothetical protein